MKGSSNLAAHGLQAYHQQQSLPRAWDLGNEGPGNGIVLQGQQGFYVPRAWIQNCILQRGAVDYLLPYPCKLLQTGLVNEVVCSLFSCAFCKGCTCPIGDLVSNPGSISTDFSQQRSPAKLACLP